MQTVIDEFLLNYEVYGSKNKQNLLVLHGWGRSLDEWRPFADFFSKKFKVIIVDLPGFGKSSFSSQKSLNTQDYALILDKFIDKLNLESVILIGHSFGGKISVVISSHNSKVEKTILISASGIKNKSLVLKIRVFLSKMFKPFVHQLPLRIRKTIYNLILPTDYYEAGSMREIFKKVVTDQINNEAQSISIPVLIIWGNNDKTLPVENAKEFKKLIKNSRIRIVWGAGHDPNLEKPEKLKEIIEEVL